MYEIKTSDIICLLDYIQICYYLYYSIWNENKQLFSIAYVFDSLTFIQWVFETDFRHRKYI